MFENNYSSGEIYLLITFTIGGLSILIVFGAGKRSQLIEKNNDYIIINKDKLVDFYRWLTLRDD